MIDEITILSIIKGRFEDIYNMSITEFFDTAYYIFQNKPDELKKRDNIKSWKELTIEERAVRLIKGGFEIQFGMPLSYFISRYKKLIEESPEKLI